MAENGPNGQISTSSVDDLMPSGEDLLYEEELLRNPYSLKMWWRYLKAKIDAPAKRRYLLFERAIRVLPGSYKLWYAYLKERRLAMRGQPIKHAGHEALNNTYERALVSMHKMPRVWLDYLELLVEQRFVTRARRTFDRALAALPVTQHDRVWQLYLKFINQGGMPAETAVRIYRRYLQLMPTHTEEFIAYLKAKERWGEAAKKLSEMLDDDTFRSLEGKSKYQLWLELCDIITKHPKEVGDMKVDAILRGGIRKFTDEVGRLWTALADFYIRRSMFDRARDVYEEGLASVVTVRDFSLVFDAYTQFEESLLAATMEAMADEEPMDADDEDDGTDFLLKDDGGDLDLRLARLEALMARRPELLSSVMLRQNPHNVHEWHKRAKLFEGTPAKQIQAYTEAVRTVDTMKAVGKPHTLWCSFAKLYERYGSLKDARIIFEKATQATMRYVDDLASVWSEWVEMELRHQNFKTATDLLRRATTMPPRPKRLSPEEERALPVQERVYKSLKLHKFLVDLEESLGTMESTKAVYDRMMELRIVNPQIILNYALFLQEHKFFEDSFKVYERGISLFKYPHVRDIWRAYLTLFVQRYGGKKLERARDLFEQAISGAPPEECKPLYLDYAVLEETHGLAKHAMEVYERAMKAVPRDQRMSILDIYVSRASQYFGIGKVREVYETAIQAQAPHELADADVRSVCVRYAALERKLGEIDRAREIFVYASQLSNPAVDKGFWVEWNAFEVAHGNEDTFREMLRIKRSVAASYSQMYIQSSTAAAAVTGAGAVEGGTTRALEGDSMEALEAAAEQEAAAAQPSVKKSGISGFVSAGVIQQGNAAGEAGATGIAAAAAANPEEIELGDDDEGGEEEEQGGERDEEEEEEGGGARGVRIKAVPAAVFGSLAGAAEEEAANEAKAAEALGAKERFKRRKLGGGDS